jgi:hypothetical protein
MAGEWSLTHSAEVEKWYGSLNNDDKRRADAAFDRLRQGGPELREPHSKSLGDGLRELRFKAQGVNTRVTYHRNGNEFRTLTVFRKQRQNERNHVERARLHMKQDRARIQKEGERTQGSGERGQSGQNRQRTRQRDRDPARQGRGRNKRQERHRSR